MFPPYLLALICEVVLVWAVESRTAVLGIQNDPGWDSEGLLGLAVEAGQSWRTWSLPPWPIRGITTTTTVLTTSVPGPTQLSSVPATDLPLSDGASTTNTGTGSPPGVSAGTETSRGVLVTDTMPSDTAGSTGLATTTNSPDDTSDSGIASNRTLVIVLSSVLSVVGVALMVGAVLVCLKYRRRGQLFFSRGISPIDDDEIATWKSPRDEKAGFHGGFTDVEAAAALAKETGGPSHAKQASTTSLKKPPSVIVYSNAQGFRQSTDGGSRRSIPRNHPAYGKVSMEQGLPQTPIQAKAPNARAGLTDETMPGDAPFLPSPKRQPSRLSKFPPNSASQRSVRHARARSSRSSTRSFGEYGSGGSELELSPRHSQDHGRHSRTYSRSHSRVYSSSSVPPRLSLGDEVPFSGISPVKPVFGEGGIGRAIG